jgi:hypothetical protein
VNVAALREEKTMKVILVTSFEDYFLEQDTLPALAARGVEVVVRFEARNVENYDLAKYKREGVEMILHMHEVGPHAASWRLTERAKEAGLPVRALSRKKASWTFLPAPATPDPPAPPSIPESERVLRPRSRGHDGVTTTTMMLANGAASEEEKERPFPAGGAMLHPGLHPKDDAAIPDRVRDFITVTRFDRKSARLRDVIRLVIAHNVTDYKSVLEAVTQGRSRGVFPCLLRLKPEQLPKLTKSMLAHELNEMRGKAHAVTLFHEDRAQLASLGLTAPEAGYTVDTEAALAALKDDDEPAGPDSFGGSDFPPIEEEKTDMSAWEGSEMQRQAEMERERAAAKAKQDGLPAALSAPLPRRAPDPGPVADELTRLRARVAELEKLEKAHAALKTLVGLGVMTAQEAAEKLFGGAS